MLSNIMDAFEAGEYNASVFLDLSKAFDCVCHMLLLQKLKFYNFSDPSIQLLRSYLENRRQKVKVGGAVSSEREVKIGVPQGSILGPLLFLIYVNDLPLYDNMSIYTLFADDTTISLHGTQLFDLGRDVLGAQLRAEQWFRANRLVLNGDKTQRMVFGLRDLGDGDRGAVKFLGINLDPHLRWTAHVGAICGRLRGTAFLLRGLRGSVSGGVLLSAYYALFHSVMTYGIIAWGGAACADRVFGLQRRVVRLLAGLSFREDCRGAFVGLGILTFPAAFVLESLLFVKKNEEQFTLQSEVHNYETRERGNIRPVFCRLKKCQSRTDFIAAKLFNKLPQQVKRLNLNKFKNCIKKYLLRLAPYSTSEVLNVPVCSLNFNVEDN